MPTCTYARAFCFTVLNFPEPQGTSFVYGSSTCMVLSSRQRLEAYSGSTRSCFHPWKRFTTEPTETLFCFQCTRDIFLHRSTQVEMHALPAGSAPSIPTAEAEGFTARSDKKRKVG